MGFFSLDRSQAKETDKKIHQEKIDIKPEEIRDDTMELFEKVVAHQMKEEGDEEQAKLFKLAESKIKKEMFSNHFKSVLADIPTGDSTREQLLDSWHKDLALAARQMGAIDVIDKKTLDSILKDQTFEQPHEKYGVWKGLKEGAKNQVEGIQFAWYAGKSLVKNDPSYYAEKAGGFMAENKDRMGWSDVMTDLWTSSQSTGSERGGKMFLADAIFLGFGSPWHVPLRFAAAQGAKAVVRQGGKTALKIGARGASTKAVQELIEGGATIHLKGLGVRWLEKDINKAAIKMAEEVMAKSGQNAAKNLPSNLIQQQKAKIISEGINSSLRNQAILKNTALGALDLMNVPLGLNARELIKGTLGYGIPVLSGMSQNVVDVSSWFTQTGNKASQLYARHNVTKFEQQLARDFIDMTGADPLSEDFESKEAWEAYKNFRIKNEGLGTILFGEKEGWGKFGNAFAETVVNLVGMSTAIKGTTKVSEAMGDRLSLIGVAELTDQINKIKSREDFGKALELNPLKEDIDRFVSEVNKLEIKGGVIEDVKLINRANQLVSAILSKSTRLGDDNPVVAQKLAEFRKLASIKSFEYEDGASNLKKIARLGNEILGELQTEAKSFHLFREHAELTKIVEHFKTLQDNDTWLTNLRVSIARNLAGGANEKTRTYLGGVSPAEAFTSRNPFFGEYFLNRAMRGEEVAKSISMSKELEVKNMLFVKELSNIRNGKIEASPFFSKLESTVKDLVDNSLKGVEAPITRKISDAIIHEGVVKSLEVYNTLSRSDMKANSSILGTGKDGYIDASKFVKTILNKNFGVDMINALASKNNKTVSSFLEGARESSADILKSDIEAIAKNDNNIFNKDSEAGKIYLERYKKTGEKMRDILNQLSESQKRTAEQFHTDLKALNMLRDKFDLYNRVSVDMPTYTERGHEVGNKVYASSRSARNEMAKNIDLNAEEISKQVLQDPTALRNFFTDDEIKLFNDENFKGLMSDEMALKATIEKNIGNISDTILKNFENELPEVKQAYSERFPEEKPGEEPVNTAGKALDLFLNDLKSKAPLAGDKLLFSKNPSISDLNRLSKISNEVRGNLYRVAGDKNIGSKAEILNKEIVKTKDKIATSKSIIETSLDSSKFLEDSIRGLESHLEKLKKNSPEFEITTSRIDMARKELMELNKILDSEKATNLRAQAEIARKDIANELSLLENRIEQVEAIREEARVAREFQERDRSIIKTAQKSIDSLNKKLEIYNKELSLLNEQREALGSGVIVDPLGKRALSDLAKESETAKDFWDKLGTRWKEIYGIKLPKELFNELSLNYSAIYDTLKQTVYTYSDGSPIKYGVSRVTVNYLPKGDLSFKFSNEYDKEIIRRADGGKVPTGRVASTLFKEANEKGFKIIEMASIQKGGRDVGLGELVTKQMTDSALLEKPEYTKDPKLDSVIDKVGYTLAETISQKIHVGLVVNSVENLNRIGSSVFKLASADGKEIAFEPNKALFKHMAEAVQASVDTGGKINRPGVNFIYNKIVKPIIDDAEAKGYTFLGSLNETGTRVYFTPTINGNPAKTAQKFFSDVLTIDQKALEDNPAKILKRIKVMNSEDIHMNPRSVAEEFKAAGFEREDGMLRGYVIDDEVHNKITVKDGQVSKDVVTTDGTLYFSPFLMDTTNKLIGLKPDNVLKASAFIPGKGKSGFVLKFMGQRLNEQEFNSNAFSSLQGKTLGDAQKDYDIFITKSTLKELGYSHKEGEAVNIPVESLRVKRIDRSLKNKTTGSMQIVESMPNKVFGHPKWEEMKKSADDQVLGIINRKVEEFASVLQKINFNKPGAIDALLESKLFKDIRGDDYMSKAINDLRAEGGYKNMNKSAIEGHLMKVFRDSVIRMEFAGAKTEMIGTNNYNALRKVVLDNYKKQGVTEDNFIVLDRKHWKDRVYNYEDGRLPEVFTYRYPVNTPANLSILKVVWADDPKVKPLIGDIGSKALVNMNDVFLKKQGDFDIDNVWIVHDNELRGAFLDLIREIPKVEAFKFDVDISKDVPFHNLGDLGFNPGNTSKLTKDQLSAATTTLKERGEHFAELARIKTRKPGGKINDLVKLIKEGRDKIANSQAIKDNPFSGESFMEKVYMLPGMTEIINGEIKVNAGVERMATRYADERISEKISNRKIEEHPAVGRFNQLNTEFATRMSEIYKGIQDYKGPTGEIDSRKIAIKENKAPEKGQGKYSLDGYNPLITNIEYHNQILKILKTKLSDRRAEINRITDSAKNTEAWKDYYEQKDVLNYVYSALEKYNGELSMQEAIRNMTIREFQQKAEVSIKSDMTDKEFGPDLQRYVLSKDWGSIKGHSTFHSKAFFLVSPEIHREYNKFYNEKYVSEDLNKSFGMEIKHDDITKINDAYSRYNEILRDPEADTFKISAAKEELNNEVREIVSSKIADARPANRELKISDLPKLGMFSKPLFDILYDSKRKPDGNYTKAIPGEYRSNITIEDVRQVKEIANNLIKENGGIIKTQAEKEAMYRAIQDANKNIITAKKALDNTANLGKRQIDRLNKTIENNKAILKQHLAEGLVIKFTIARSEAKSRAAIAEATLKKEMISEGDIKDQERKVAATESRKNQTEDLIETTKDELVKNEIETELIREMQELTADLKIALERVGSEDARQRLLDKHAVEAEEITNKAFAKLFVRTANASLSREGNKFLKQHDIIEEQKRSALEAKNEIAKMYDLEPSDFMSQLFETYTKAYKSIAVGMMAGRAAIETVNAGVTTMAKEFAGIYHNNVSDKAFQKRFGKVKDFKVMESDGFKGQIYEEFVMRDMGDLTPNKRNKILRSFNESIQNVAGFISGRIVNLLPSKMAEKYYQTTFRQLLWEEASKKDGTHKQKLYLLRDPSKLNDIERTQYYNTKGYLEEMAKGKTQQAFFNYDMNPLIVSKMEAALPFTNFMFSGFRLMRNHPHSILGMNVVFRSIINNYGDQVGYVMDDENGDPIRIDYGKRVRLPLLGMYTGASINFDRLLQFSPSDTRIGMAPLFSYLSGDMDWRVKSWQEGNMSGMELAMGAISPSISQLASGLYENDYQKQFSAWSYMLTGLASKSNAHAKVANQFYIQQDYHAVKEAPSSVKEHLFKSLSKKGGNEVTEKTLDALIAAKDIGLFGEPVERNSFGVFKREDPFKEAVKIHGMMMTLASQGHTDPAKTEQYYKDEGRNTVEFMKWVVGSDFFENVSEEGWLEKVVEFADAGHLEELKKVNLPYANAMEHYYNNRKYYAKRIEAQGKAYGEDSSQEEKTRGQAELLALKYEFAGAGTSLREKTEALLDGEVRYILNEDGTPRLTKEAIEEIDYRGFYVANYEKTVSEHMLYRDLRQLYNTLGHKYKTSDKKLASQYFNNAKMYERKMISSFRKIEEEHNIDAEIFNAKRIARNLKPMTTDSGETVLISEPIQNLMTERRASLNEFYNQIATDRVKFLETTDLKWSQLNNAEKATFMSVNNGKTINQARDELAVQKSFYNELLDMEIPKRSSANIQLIKEKLYD